MVWMLKPRPFVTNEIIRETESERETERQRAERDGERERETKREREGERWEGNFLEFLNDVEEVLC